MGAQLAGINLLGAGTPAQVARLDPATGALTVLSTLDTDGGFIDAFSAYDGLTHHLYEFTEDTIYTIDATNGAVLAEVPYDGDDIYNPETNAAGEIVVVHNSTASTAKLDPSAGALTDLAPLPTVQFGQGMSASDKSADLIYQISDTLVVTIDGASGVVLSTATLSDHNFLNPEVDAAGELVGDHYGSAKMFARLDPSSGVITDLAPITTGFANGMKAYDAACDVEYQPSGFTMYAITSTGSLAWTAGMAQQNFLNFEAVP